MYRTTGKAQLTWAELEEVLLGFEIILNNRPLNYIEEDIDYPILTPNSLILGRIINFPDAAPHESESETMKKRLSISNDVKKVNGKHGNMSI